jgi:hypothetical protein
MATVISAKLDRITREAGYLVGYNPMKRQRKNGWPVENSKPFALYLVTEKAGKAVYTFIASFKSAEALEKNFRARTAC